MFNYYFIDLLLIVLKIFTKIKIVLLSCSVAYIHIVGQYLYIYSYLNTLNVEK